MSLYISINLNVESISLHRNKIQFSRKKLYVYHFLIKLLTIITVHKNSLLPLNARYLLYIFLKFISDVRLILVLELYLYWFKKNINIEFYNFYMFVNMVNYYNLYYLFSYTSFILINTNLYNKYFFLRINMSLLYQ